MPARCPVNHVPICNLGRPRIVGTATATARRHPAHLDTAGHHDRLQELPRAFPGLLDIIRFYR